jgi:hypothetical protein
MPLRRDNDEERSQRMAEALARAVRRMRSTDASQGAGRQDGQTHRTRSGSDQGGGGVSSVPDVACENPPDRKEGRSDGKSRTD